MNNTSGPPNSSRDTHQVVDWGALFKHITTYFNDLVDLKKGVDPQTTIFEIRNNTSMTGANAWMLICSILIASIGLSQNSGAVIIGAMLISPLMSPILGIGLSVGIQDIQTLRNSLLHFGIAIFISLLTSWIYFELTPFTEYTHEIRSRTSPTFLDILVAIFGGVAGIVSIARKDVSMTLPGVAIATALMPPLCVAGYGLANGYWEMASKSFYLFFLNSFFVALSTYFIVRYLKFPFQTFVNAKTRRKNLLYLALFTLALTIPSILIFRSVLQDLNLQNSMQSFNQVCLGADAKYVDSYHHERNKDGSMVIYLKVYGGYINTDQIDTYTECLSNLGVRNFKLEIISTSDVNIDDVNILNSGLQDIKARLESVQNERELITKSINYYKNNYLDTLQFNYVREEIKSLFPDIQQMGLSKMHRTDFASTTYNTPVIILRWPEDKENRQEEEEKLLDFLRARLQSEELDLISY